MTRFAVIAPPFASHVRALEALAAQLLERGHRVLWLHQPDVAQLLARHRAIEFHAVGAARFPEGSLSRIVAHAARPGGPFGLRRVIRDLARATGMLCDEVPALLRAHAVEVVLADEMEAAGGLIAPALGLPWISVACALPVNREPRLPLPVMPWALADAQDAAALQRNAVSTRIHDWLMTPLENMIRRHAAAFGLGQRTTLEDCLSPLLQLSQTTPGFDFPRTAAPPWLQHVGPLRLPLAEEAALALDPPDDGRPLVFASLGTLQGGRFSLFRRVARACRALDLQLLIAHCGGLDAAQCSALESAGARWVVDFAPQRAVLARADAVVTHGGMNTVMDALVAGTPMLVLPIAFDQHGVAARVLHARAGLRLVPTLATVAALHGALARLLHDPSFGAQAATLGREIGAGDAGARHAADLIEAALQDSATASRPRTAPREAADSAAALAA